MGVHALSCRLFCPPSRLPRPPLRRLCACCLTPFLPLVLPLQIMRMVPTAPAKLLQIIVAGMPHKLRDRDTQCLYLSAGVCVGGGGEGEGSRKAGISPSCIIL